MGKGNALYILLSGRLLDASEALRIGLVNQVVPIEELEEYTYRLANDIAALAPLSHAVNKETLRQVQLKTSLADLTAEEADLPLTQFDTRDYQEGYQAFLEKRRPPFYRRIARSLPGLPTGPRKYLLFFRCYNS